jgi:PhoH-like ATPase
MAKKTYVIDTSVFLSDANCLFRFKNNDIVIPLKVLEEIDKHKKRQDSVGFNARLIIKHLDGLRSKGSLHKGLRIGKGMGILRVGKASKELPADLDFNVPDHQILSVALAESKENQRRKVIVVSRDINMRVIADSLGLISEDYETNSVVEDKDKVYDGYAELVVDDEFIEQFYAGEEKFLEEELVAKQKTVLYPNQFIMLISSANPKKTALSRFIDYKSPIHKIDSKLECASYGIKPRNKEQSFAFDLLFDDSIPLVTLIGKAGSGKTLMAIAAGLEQTLGFGDHKYKKVVVSRPVQPLGKDIGFLPGTMQEKMMPWLMPIQDNLEFILGNKQMFKSYLEKGSVEIEALTYIRGRSISNAFIIIDEAQNLTAHEVKTIITRVGENTKVILTGDIEQIDNIYTNETSNGLTYAIERFKTSHLSGHITFKKGERSKIATLASQLL